MKRQPKDSEKEILSHKIDLLEIIFFSSIKNQRFGGFSLLPHGLKGVIGGKIQDISPFSPLSVLAIYPFSKESSREFLKNGFFPLINQLAAFFFTCSLHLIYCSN